MARSVPNTKLSDIDKYRKSEAYPLETKKGLRVEKIKLEYTTVLKVWV